MRVLTLQHPISSAAAAFCMHYLHHVDVLSSCVEKITVSWYAFVSEVYNRLTYVGGVEPDFRNFVKRVSCLRIFVCV